MADTFPATGLFDENDVPAGIAPVHFTGFQDIYYRDHLDFWMYLVSNPSVSR
jgi:hypothetical protein